MGGVSAKSWLSGCEAFFPVLCGALVWSENFCRAYFWKNLKPFCLDPCLFTCGPLPSLCWHIAAFSYGISSGWTEDNCMKGESLCLWWWSAVIVHNYFLFSLHVHCVKCICHVSAEWRSVVSNEVGIVCSLNTKPCRVLRFLHVYCTIIIDYTITYYLLYYNYCQQSLESCYQRALIFPVDQKFKQPTNCPKGCSWYLCAAVEFPVGSFHRSSLLFDEGHCCCLVFY